MTTKIDQAVETTMGTTPRDARWDVPTHLECLSTLHLICRLSRLADSGEKYRNHLFRTDVV